MKTCEVNSPDESADACSCYDAVPWAEGTNAVDKLASASQLAIQPRKMVAVCQNGKIVCRMTTKQMCER